MKITSLLLLALFLYAEPLTQHFGVQTVTVTKENVARTATYYGYLAVDESRSYALAPRFGGYVAKLYADKRYAFVKTGEALAEVYSPEVLQAKEEYRNALLYDRRHGNAPMVQSARTKLTLLSVPEAEITSLSDAKNVDEHTVLRAPVSGYLFDKKVKSGSAFKPGMVLFEIVNTDRLWAEAALYQRDLSRIDGFTRFELRPEGMERWYSAKKEQLLPEMTASQSTATLRLSVENGRHELLPGMYFELRAYGESREQLTIPKSAAIRKHGRWYVFAEGEYEGEYEPIEVGLRPLDDTRYEILSGLAEGDSIVGNALFMIDADAQINGLY